MSAECSHKDCVPRRGCRAAYVKAYREAHGGERLAGERAYLSVPRNRERKTLIQSLRRLDARIAFKEARIRSLAAQLGLQVS